MKLKLLLLLAVLILCKVSLAQTFTLESKWVSCGNNTLLLDPYYSSGVSFQWTGSSKNGKADGYGVATKYNNGKFESKYEGTYKNGIREGKGKFTHVDGSVKTGTFIDGQLFGRGTMTTEDGHSYEGEFVNYRMHGNGVFRYANGASFVGVMANDAPYTGKFTDYNSAVTFIQKGEPIEHLSETKSHYHPKIGKRITEYFDENWNRCQASQAAYYRLITYQAPNRPLGIVKDYYITGEIQSEQYPVFIDYDDDSHSFLEGEQVFYHKNGSVERKQQYYNNRLNGPSISYYEDGTIASEIMFSYGVPHGDAIEYNQDGTIATVRKFEYGRLYNNKYLQVTDDEMVFLVYDENFIRNREAWEYQGQSGIVQVNDAESISIQASPERSVSGGIYT